jgi:hypothetical protein
LRHRAPPRARTPFAGPAGHAGAIKTEEAVARPTASPPPRAGIARIARAITMAAGVKSSSRKPSGPDRDRARYSTVRRRRRQPEKCVNQNDHQSPPSKSSPDGQARGLLSYPRRAHRIAMHTSPFHMTFLGPVPPLWFFLINLEAQGGLSRSIRTFRGSVLL